ncbi:glucokinase [Sphaerisporangium melleum]|uniref:Glucokinase n=1 Tax=Sphaerisporangium melleum TaxID=321316 RepID=A0A917R704_9ACTN|nr:glucokinase [Sphaerisporangium melleum]GGK93504.1 glucokinase [Sphaerisporangium melleum]GII73403.1 glucokinase [Sphaerisporangium melleum]
MTGLPSPSQERPWLVADIGGTNARFGLVSRPGGRPGTVAVLPVAEFDGLPAAVTHYLTHQAGGVLPAAASLAIAGPVNADRYRLTNAAWSGSVTALGIAHVELLNDFEALALALPHLTPGELSSLGGPEPAPYMVKAVLGPGTGLGVAALVPSRSGWVPVPGEGGHVSAPAVTDLEFEIVRALRADGMSFVDAEHLLSGPGLTRLRHGLALVESTPVAPLPASEIVARPDDPLCARTVEVFCGLLGSFAANVALTLGAHGGVYLGGGIVPRLVDRILHSDFRRRFEANLVLSGYLTGIATTAIVAGHPALTGAAAWLAHRATGADGAFAAVSRTRVTSSPDVHSEASPSARSTRA